MFNPTFKGNIQGRKHPGKFAFAKPELICFRKPKRVVQNKNNGHKNPNDSHNYKTCQGVSKRNTWCQNAQIAITPFHYDDAIMSTIASQITSLMVLYSIVYSDADQRKHQSSASLAFVWGIHRDRWIPRTKGQLRGKCFHLMTSSG